MEIKPLKKIISDPDLITKNFSWYFTINKKIKKIEIIVNSLTGQILIQEDNKYIHETGKFISLIEKLNYEYKSENENEIMIRLTEDDEGFLLYLNGKNFEKNLKKLEKNMKQDAEPLEDNFDNILNLDKIENNPFKEVNFSDINPTKTPFD